MSFPKIIISSVIKEEKLLKVKFENIDSQEIIESTFHIYWLRDNCRCPNCYTYSSNQRFYYPSLDVFQNLNISHLEVKHNLNLKKESVETEYNPQQSTLEVHWSDDHQSSWNGFWLWQRSWSNEHKNTRFFQYEAEDFLEEHEWNAEELSKRGGIPTFDYEKISNESKELKKFCKNLIQQGITLIKNCGTETGVVKNFSKLISFGETTNYGKVFKVASKVNPSNVAYSNLPLPIHTDLAYQQLTPGVQLLHCIKQSMEGGSNTFVDGFKVCNYMKLNHSLEFETLTTTLVDYWDLGSDYLKNYHYTSKKYCIEVDNNGKVVSLNINHNTRNSFFNVDPSKHQLFYESYFLFFKLAQSPMFQITNRMTDGDMVIFSNRRVLHGRETFSSPGSQETFIRVLEGGYIRMEDVISKYRVLRNEESQIFNDILN